MKEKDAELGKNTVDFAIDYEGHRILVEHHGEKNVNPNELIKLREEIGMNRKQFAEYLGIPYRTITDWERGERQMPGYLLRLLTYAVKTGGIHVNEEKDEFEDE